MSGGFGSAGNRQSTDAHGRGEQFFARRAQGPVRSEHRILQPPLAGAQPAGPFELIRHSMNDVIPQPHHTVSEVMRRWPQTITLFLQYGTACPGCPVGAFHTIEEAALEYRIPLRAFLSDLRDSARESDNRSIAKRRPRAVEGRRRVQP